MSNNAIGQLYAKVIDDVCTASISIFDEEGAERSVIEEVKKMWQKKLSERKIAQLPWDPQPPPPPAPAPTTYLPPPSEMTSQVKMEPTEYQPIPSVMDQAPVAEPPSKIKSEPQDASFSSVPEPYIPPPQTISPTNPVSQPLPSLAGAAANGAPQLTQEQVEAQKRLYQQKQAELMRQRMPSGNGSSLPKSQVDGAADWDAMVEERQKLSADVVSNADFSLKTLVEQRMLQSEGGGVMKPHVRSSRAGRSRTQARQDAYARRLIESVQPSKGDGTPGIPQGDAPGDSSDHENEEDEIGSDLDDPEDEQLAAQDSINDADLGDIMLCTYEKVNRVRNRWRCTLKEGLLATGGKEYVFTKAMGEFEW